MNKIRNDLIEAYKGFYEDELNIYGHAKSQESGMSAETHIDLKVQIMIKSHTPKERLEVYLMWNGILGYTNTIWEISQGEIYVA